MYNNCIKHPLYHRKLLGFFAQKEDYEFRSPLDKVYIDKPLNVFTVE